MIKRLHGRDIGYDGRHTIILTDDEGIKRRFTVRNAGPLGSKHHKALCFKDGHFLYLLEGDSVDVEITLTTEQKLAKVVDALKADAGNPLSARLLSDIGEA